MISNNKRFIPHLMASGGLVLAVVISLSGSAYAQRGMRRFFEGGGFGGGFPSGMTQPPGQPGQPSGTPPTGTPTPPADPNQAQGGSSPPKNRPDRPERPPNPEELNITPNKDGKLQFSFRGQAWQDVLEWVAKISNCSLDWQEMPGGFLNLQTQRAYTVVEVRDLINHHLLDRGYSMLQDGEVISVVNLKKVDPSMVPRVTPAELEKHQPHEFVRVLFPLDSLIAESTVEELKPMLSPNHKIFPLKATNRVEVMDSVVNLSAVAKMLQEEQQSSRGKDRLVKQFKLKHTRAGEVIDQLYGILGMEKPSAGDSGPKNPQEMMMRQQQMMMQQQMMQQQGAAGVANRQSQSKVTMVVNTRENSILASAPPDRMAAIESAIQIIDVPTGLEGGSPLEEIGHRMQIYRLSGLDPELLVKFLNQMGRLDPTTQLDVDKKNRAIIANATLADHFLIKTLVERMDSSGRSFEVRQLRRLQADYVAGTIDFVMGTGQKKDQNSRRRGGWWDPWSMGGGSEESKDESREFRVEADVEHNRLLLYANTAEVKQIDDLLVQLGEVRPGGSNKRVRVIENLSEEEAQELLRKLKRAWPNVAPNPLEDDVPRTAPAPREETTPPKGAPVPPQPKSPSASIHRQETDQISPDGVQVKKLWSGAPPYTILAALKEEPQKSNPVPPPAAAAPQAPAAKPVVPPAATTPPPAQEPPAAPQVRRRAAPAPVRITRDLNGNLVIMSDDLDALDQLEEMAEELRPVKKDWKIFYLKNKSIYVSDIVWNLKDYFKSLEDAASGATDDDYMRGWYGWPQSDKKEDNSKRLSKRRKLSFISDNDTHSIMVVGADPAQLAQIEELIKVWDVAETTDTKAIRVSQVFTIRYSKAKVISDALKDVYRDLLSVNDPAMQQGRQDQQRGGPGGGMTYVQNYGFGRNNNSKDGDKRENEPPIRFKGLISIGVDEVSNSLLVSTTKGIMEVLSSTIKSLDEAAKPMAPSVQVVKLNRDVDVGVLQEKLNKVFGKATAGPQGPAQNPPQNQQPMNNNAGAGRRGQRAGNGAGNGPAQSDGQ